jgi:class 3 adenylate cyclase
LLLRRRGESQLCVSCHHSHPDEMDAKACLSMAVEMQRRVQQLNNVWRQRGIEEPFQARIGINTGFCNVENFGSEDRMDYTTIEAEANLAARLQR